MGVLPAQSGGEEPLPSERHGLVHQEELVQAGSPRVPGQGQVVDMPLVIEADAPLVDGLRALLVHHLKKSIGTSVVNLSVSQAELLEHHLSRLASYAQKIVHTLAFATRFLARQSAEAEAYDSLHPGNGSFGTNATVASFPAVGARPLGGAQGPGTCPPDGSARAGVPRIPMHPPAPEPRNFRKPLKLRDDEILDLYRSAQAEAAIEADWRGIQGPTPSRGGGSSDGGATARSSACSQKADPWTSELVTEEARGQDQEYLRILSRALQQPGRSPRAVTAELLDPSAAKQDVACCDPRAEAMLDGVLGRQRTAQGADGSGEAVTAMQSPELDGGLHAVV